MITASSSSRLKLNQSKRGNAFNGSGSAGLIPQSNITLLSGVMTIKQDLPTCLTPPRQNSVTSSLLADQDWGLLNRGSLVAVVVIVVVCCCCCCCCCRRGTVSFPLTLLTTRGSLNTRLPSFCINSVLSFAELFNVECSMLMLDEGI